MRILISSIEIHKSSSKYSVNLELVQPWLLERIEVCSKEDQANNGDSFATILLNISPENFG